MTRGCKGKRNGENCGNVRMGPRVKSLIRGKWPANEPAAGLGGRHGKRRNDLNYGNVSAGPHQDMFAEQAQPERKHVGERPVCPESSVTTPLGGGRPAHMDLR